MIHYFISIIWDNNLVCQNNVGNFLESSRKRFGLWYIFLVKIQATAVCAEAELCQHSAAGFYQPPGPPPNFACSAGWLLQCCCCYCSLLLYQCAAGALCCSCSCCCWWAPRATAAVLCVGLWGKNQIRNSAVCVYSYYKNYINN